MKLRIKYSEGELTWAECLLGRGYWIFCIERGKEVRVVGPYKRKSQAEVRRTQLTPPVRERF